jgi:hypothetical protein
MLGGWSGCRIQHAVPEVGRLQTECGEQPVANVIISRYTEGKMQHTKQTHGEHSSEWEPLRKLGVSGIEYSINPGNSFLAGTHRLEPSA